MGRLLLCVIVLFASLVAAQAADRSVTVSGEASIGAAPDGAVVRIGVSTQANTAREASSANAEKMTAVVAALKDAAIADKDVQTAWLSLQPQYSSGTPSAPHLVGFRANNQLSVKVHDVKALPNLLDKAITAGATEVSGIDFVVFDESKLLDQAREQAVTDARRKAELYVKATGAHLGPVISIVEDNAGSMPPRPMAAVRAAAVPVMAGEETLRLKVTVVYALEP